MKIGQWQLDTVNGGMFRLDGGVMFGVVPRTLWQGVMSPDPQNRIRVANHCVLARNGRNTVLIDTGYGGKYAPLDRRFYDMEEGEPLIANLAALDVSPEMIDTVVFSHLHFDHVGGATRFNEHKERVLNFPRARHVVGRIEWADANSGAPELQTAYTAEDIQPLQDAAQLNLIDGDDMIMPGLRALVSGGHTRGHLVLLFESDGETALYIGDLCPSTAHMRRMWCMAYDVQPLETRRTKPRLLGEAADRNWWILWNHDPTVVASRVQRDPKREFVPVDPRTKL